MTLNRADASDIAARLRHTFANGHARAATEWARLLATTADPELLRAIIGVLADHIDQPKPGKKTGRPKTKAAKPTVEVSGDGRANVTIELPPTTRSEQRAALRDLKIHAAIEADHAKGKRNLTGSIDAIARKMRITEAEARKAYYRVKTGSP